MILMIAAGFCWRSSYCRFLAHRDDCRLYRNDCADWIQHHFSIGVGMTAADAAKAQQIPFPVLQNCASVF